MSDLPDFLQMPTPGAIEVFQAAFDNHTDSVPFDGRLVPNQWLLNERGITATVAADFESQIESLQRELKSANTEAAHYERFAKQAEARVEELLSRPAITPEMREELSAALTWIEKQIDTGSDVTISRLHEHSTFGPAVVVSVRRGYSSPAKIYGETLVGAISTAANSDLLGEQG